MIKAMLGIDRRAARYTWTAAVILLLLVAVYRIRTTLFAFIVAVLIAYLLSPLVDLLDRLLPARRTRTLALVIAYLILVGLLIFAGFELGSRIVDEANALIAKIPDLIKSAAETLPAPGPRSVLDNMIDNIRNQIAQHAGDFVGYLPRVSRKAISLAGNLLWIVIIPILSFFFLKDGRAMWLNLIELVDEGPYRALIEDVARDINVLLLQYMRALLLLSLFTLTFFSFYLTVTHVPYGLLLAATAALLEFIPIIGPLTAAVAILFVAGFSGYPHILWILVFLAIYRLFQDYIVSPRLMSAGMELHPLLVMFGVFAGGELGGIPGTFLSVPVLAFVRILYLRIERAHREALLAKVPS